MRADYSEGKKELGSGLSILHLALILQFVVELVTGIFLSFVYRSNKPYDSTSYLHHSWLAPLQSFHYWASSLLILESALLLVVLVWTGKYAKPFHLTFFSTLFLLGSSLGFQMSGNLLPGDRHGVQTAVIEASIAARVPVVGSRLQQLTLGGSEFGPSTIGHWYGLHLLLTLLALATLFLAYQGKGIYSRRPNSRLVLLAGAPALLLALVVASPLGDAATAADATAFADRASWYTWPLHGALVLSTRISPSLGWVGAMLIPGACAAFLLFLPLAKKQIPHNVTRTSVAVIIAFFAFAAIFFGGSIDPLTGKRNPEADTVVAQVGKAKPIDPVLAMAGKKAFNAETCSGCHGEDGKKGEAGPTLTNVFKKHPDAEYYEKYVKNPQLVDANSTMPSFPKLSDKQLSEIAEFLRSPIK